MPKLLLKNISTAKAVLIFFGKAERFKCTMRRRRIPRKKVVMSQRRYERACTRIADANVPFCEKGGARQRADVFLQRKTEQSELCSDVGAGAGFEPTTSGL